MICNIFRSQDSAIPTDVEYVNNGGMMTSGWGVSISGTAYYNGISGEDVDPIVPSSYGKNDDPEDGVEMNDSCFGHPGGIGDYHYHSASPCMVDAAKGASGAVNVGTEFDAKGEIILGAIKDAWGRERPYRSVAGISKDGRPIYGPFYDNGKMYADCDVDVCNGAIINGNYAYVMTDFHPYVMGCYGPGNYPAFSQ